MERITIDSYDERIGSRVFLVLGVQASLRIAVPSTPALLQVEHQCGGYSCDQRSVTGLVLPLTLGLAGAKRPLGPLLAGFDLLSDVRFPAIDPLPDRRLKPFGFTSGNSIDVDKLSAIVRDYVELPRFVDGIEAFVWAPFVDPARFRGWNVWHPDGALQFDDALADQLIVASVVTRQPLECFLLWFNSD